MTESAARCPAAHAEDAQPCEGQPDAVSIVDQYGVRTAGCIRHGAALLASLESGKVYVLNGPDGSAIEVYYRAKRPTQHHRPIGGAS
jgi:hypothetical protein